MTPFEIDILMWYATRPDDHEVIEKNPPIWAETHKYFLEEKLLEFVPTGPQRYRLSERGRVYINHLLGMPLPVCKWVLPE